MPKNDDEQGFIVSYKELLQKKMRDRLKKQELFMRMQTQSKTAIDIDEDEFFDQKRARNASSRISS